MGALWFILGLIVGVVVGYFICYFWGKSRKAVAKEAKSLASKAGGMFLLTGCLLLFFPYLSQANPWLVCDPMTAEVVSIQLNLNGQLIDVSTATMQKEADAWYLLDLSSIVAGSYTVKAKADYGSWGWSNDSVPFDFVKPALVHPRNVIIKF